MNAEILGRPELLAPAGNMEKLAAALAYGADAVYFSGQSTSLRAPGAGLSAEDLPRAIKAARRAGAGAYLCLNALPRENGLARAAKDLEQAAMLAPDALIVADPGIMAMARDIAPHIPIHVSTQANTANSRSAMFWESTGAKRVNLARELGAKQTRAIIKALDRAGSKLELETFVHGAMCMAVSGRCLLSAHLTGRQANQGLCTHPCRFDYRVTDPPRAFLEEGLRRGRPTWEVVEHENFSKILAANDLCLVKYLAWFSRLGIKAIKIEGRMRSAGVLAQTVDAYATALSDLAAGTFRHAKYLAELENAATRPLSTGFFLPDGERLLPTSDTPRKPVLALVRRNLGKDKWLVSVKGPWESDRPAALMLPGLHRPELAPGDYGLEDENGQKLGTAHPGLDAVLTCSVPGLGAGMFIRQG